MFVLVPSDASKLTPAIAALSEGRSISVLDHNTICVLLGSISDFVVDPEAMFSAQGIQLPKIQYAGAEYPAAGLRAEPTAWWNPDPMTGIDAMRRMVFRACNQLLRVLSAVRAERGMTAAAGALAVGVTGTVATYARVADAVVPMPFAQSDVAKYPADMPSQAVAQAIAFLIYAADYIGQTVVLRLTPVVQPTAELRQGEQYAQALAEAYRKEMVRNYWIDLGAFGLAIAAGLIAAYQSNPPTAEQLEVGVKVSPVEEVVGDVIDLED